jgi:hypothetical protein
MRTTLDLDPDVLMAAKELAARSRRTAGQVISEVFRRGLQQPSAGDKVTRPVPGRRLAAGFEVIPANGRVVTTELVRRLREESEDR